MDAKLPEFYNETELDISAMESEGGGGAPTRTILPLRSRGHENLAMDDEDGPVHD